MIAMFRDSLTGECQISFEGEVLDGSFHVAFFPDDMDEPEAMYLYEQYEADPLYPWEHDQ